MHAEREQCSWEHKGRERDEAIAHGQASVRAQGRRPCLWQSPNLQSIHHTAPRAGQKAAALLCQTTGALSSNKQRDGVVIFGLSGLPGFFSHINLPNHLLIAWTFRSQSILQQSAHFNYVHVLALVLNPAAAKLRQEGAADDSTKDQLQPPVPVLLCHLGGGGGRGVPGGRMGERRS